MAYFLYNLPSDNVAALATWAAEASADSAYPASNIPDLSDLNRGNPGKLTIKTAGGWTADFGAAQRIDLVVLWHNGDAAQTVQVQFNATNAWGSPTVTTTVTLPAKREDGFFVKVPVICTGLSGYSTSGLRWMRIHFPVAGPNNTQNWGLKVWCGSVIRQLDRPLETQQHNAEQHQVLSLSTDFGYVWRYDLQAAPRLLTGKINLSKATSWVNVLSWYRGAGGPTTPILLIPDSTISDAWIARFGANLADGVSLDMLDIQRNSPGENPVNVSFSEITAGGPEWT